MKKWTGIFVSLSIAAVCYAADPIIQTSFTADPAPMVHDGVVYLYTSHDDDNAPSGQGRFLMPDWKCYSSTDMVNWTDHGTVASLKTFPWAVQENDAWAPHVIERNGKFYFYAPVSVPGWPKNVIAVAVADTPLGPFKDALGRPLIDKKTGYIDPAAFIDDDGQAYLYWGNPNIWYVKLNEDMISYSGGIVQEPTKPDNYQEGPWLYKRDGRYYMAYASTCCPEGIGYAMSDNPTGPWIYKGYIMRPDRRTTGNHPGMIEYKGSSYVFGFNYKLNFALTDQHHERRSVCVAKYEYNPDGTIPELPWWEEVESVPQIGTLDPYVRTEAETIAWSEGIKSEPCSRGGMNVYPTRDNAFIKVKGVNFGEGAGTFTASIAYDTQVGASKSGAIELHLDSVDGPLIGTLPVTYTCGQWKIETTVVTGADGIHDLFLIFKGDSTGNLFKIDYWQFAKKTATPQLVALDATVDHYKIDSVHGAANRVRLKVFAIYSDGTSRDVTGSARITVRKPDVASVRDGIISGVTPGMTEIDAVFADKSDVLPVIVKDLKSEFVPRKLTVSVADTHLIAGNTQAFTATAEFLDGHTEDVTDKAVFTVENPKVVSVRDGLMTALEKGDTTIHVVFKGDLGNPVTALINIAVSYRDPFVQNSAAEFNEEKGIQTEDSAEGGKNIGFIENGDWVRFNRLDFGAGAGTVELRVASATNGGTIEIRLDRVDGLLVGSCKVNNTSGWQSWITQTCELSGVKGRHDVVFRFVGGPGFLLNMHGWKFNQNPVQTQKQIYQPDFESLEKANPVPEWFKDAKFGIYFHWGVYSVPAFANEWYPRNMYRKGSSENKYHLETYGEVSEWPYHKFITGAKDKQGRFMQFAPKLKSEGGKFDPDEWAQLFADAGAKFAGPVAEHHDGFSMWASKANPWNAKDTGPQLDLVGLLADVIRKRDMKVILSMHHAYNITGFYDAVPKTDDPKIQMLYGQQGKEKNEAFWLNKHKEIIDNYQPDILWQDFNLHVISKSVLLEFLAYYYNQATAWGKEVVATYKDGLNPKCAVLDYERGGPADITENYWLTDDAISSSSWCYTEGIGYYSKKQILHGFLDRISKNGNLLLNISPKADGTIPQEQKDILLTMGAWLKKYGEAVYATRAWEKYGEGPTKMGAAHGVMGPPSEGTAKDARYTRSKDNTTLYAILLGWEKDQKEIKLASLASDRIDIKNLKSVELINGEAAKYLPLTYKQDTEGLTVYLPERSFEELAYVLKLNFEDRIPPLDKYADLNCTPHYHLVPGDNTGNLVLGSDLTLTGKRKVTANQWKLEPAGKGIYKILNREDGKKVFECGVNNDLMISNDNGKDSQFWRIENSYNGLLKISNKQFPNIILSVNTPVVEGSKAGLLNSENSSLFGWKLMDVCELKQEAFKPHTIPGTIEAEDFDTGCPGDAYYDRDEINEGGQYRLNEGVDIEKCAAGGYNVGWTHIGDWMAYTVTVSKSASYQISFYIASAFDSGKLHLECDGADITGIISIPNTTGFQNWEVVTKTVNLDAGQHLLNLVVDGDYLNLDKMVFEEMK